MNTILKPWLFFENLTTSSLGFERSPSRKDEAARGNTCFAAKGEKNSNNNNSNPILRNIGKFSTPSNLARVQLKEAAPHVSWVIFFSLVLVVASSNDNDDGETRNTWIAEPREEREDAFTEKNPILERRSGKIDQS